jgi:hypothetical protein
MRNLSWLLAALFFLIACFFGYKYFCVNKEKSTADVDKTRCAPCMEYNNVSNDYKLDFNLVSTMAYYYQSDPHNTPNTGGSSIKTRSVWLSLEKLKEFIYQIESKSCRCEGNLGVRVYFAVYPPDVDWTSAIGFKNDLDNPQNNDFRHNLMTRYTSTSNPYEKINTIFLVPTIESGGINYDFDPADSQMGCKPEYNAKYGKGVLSDTTNQYIHKSFGSSITALSATNHGDACPPFPNGSNQCPGAFFNY